MKRELMRCVLSVLLAAILLLFLEGCKDKTDHSSESSKDTAQQLKGDTNDETVDSEFLSFEGFMGLDFGEEGLELPEDDLSNIDITESK